MKSENVFDEIEKLKFHIGLLSRELLDAKKQPISSLVVGLDWSEADLDTAHGIFEEYESILFEKEKISWTDFAKSFEEKLGVTNPQLEAVVLAFCRDTRYVEICQAYARSFGSEVTADLKSILFEY
ncbi:hypothetical protein [Cellvibrio polysaccharolyticus]|uniref:Uncharacterized protein n=1 Tax=Cellvibrio polysaccharolyticus TaxID=2082724 RepID=A0A928YTK3_9GAMM|nr:hypothetical protein [Cellvibrio polysaccharolyticus]MBE8717641.1 hypothetical protein [Cellvibrio polysaccharolyticus]